MQQSRSDVKQEQLQWRRDKVLELAADGYSEREIATQLKLTSDTTVHRDLVFLKQQAKEHIRKYIDERVPFEYQKTLAGLEGIIRSMSKIISANAGTDNKEIMAASSIKMQAYNMKMELVSNANLVHEAIELVEKYRGYSIQKGNVLIDGTEQST